MVELLILLAALALGHMVADFPMQTDHIAKMKNRHRAPDPPAGQTPQAVWPHVLTAHAGVHASAVWIITGLWWLAVAELICHWCIDFAKCENWTGIHTDQTLHYACKAVWVVLMTCAGIAPWWL